VNTGKAPQINDLCKEVKQRSESATTDMVEALRLAVYRLESLLELSHMSWASVKEIADYILERKVHLTRSKLGIRNEQTIMKKQVAWSLPHGARTRNPG